MSKKFEFFEKHHFLLRRLHSLTGIVPTGLFLISHLLTNSSIVWGILDRRHAELGHAGVATFQHEVNFIHSIPFLLLIEIFGLWLPIAFHSVLGWYYANSSSDNTNRYPFNGNWRYRLQRISGYVGVFFILYHVATLRWGLTWLVPGGTEWSAEAAASTTAAVLRGSFDRGITLGGLMVSCMYLGGASLLVFHFANGLWTAAITWGITVSKQAQERWGVACLGLGAALMLMAWSAVFGFLLLDPQKAAEVEARMGGHSASGEAVKTQPPK